LGGYGLVFGFSLMEFALGELALLDQFSSNFATYPQKK
jgi:hypothetical protein